MVTEGQHEHGGQTCELLNPYTGGGLNAKIGQPDHGLLQIVFQRPFLSPDASPANAGNVTVAQVVLRRATAAKTRQGVANVVKPKFRHTRAPKQLQMTSTVRPYGTRLGNTCLSA